MYKAEFELEAITPIFMRGANQREAELRASSIKGLMRWWFRALAGNYFGDNIKGLREAESYVFGDTERRSRVLIFVEPVSDYKEIDISKIRNNSKYLWFSINLLYNKDEIKYYYPEKSKFIVRIQAFDRKSYMLSLLSFWYLVVLGGIGFRSRRAAGCVRFSDGDIDELHKVGLKTSFISETDLKDSINKGIDIFGDLIGNKMLNFMCCKYPVLNKNTSYVGLWKCGTNDIFKILNKLDVSYRSFRRNQIKKRDRVVLGLPLKLRGRYTKYLPTKKLENTRRASTLIIGLLYIGKTPYVKVCKFKTCPYHIDVEIDKIVSYNPLKLLDQNIFKGEIDIYGSLEVFE